MIKLRFVCAAVVAISGMLPSVAPADAYTHIEKRVGVLMFVSDSRPCAFIAVEGMPPSNPTVDPAHVWMVLPKSDPRYVEMLSLLITAKSTGMKVDLVVGPTLNSDCGEFPLTGIVAKY